MQPSYIVETSVSSKLSDDSDSDRLSISSSFSAADEVLSDTVKEHEEEKNEANCFSILLDQLLEVDHVQSSPLQDHSLLGLRFLFYFRSLEAMLPEKNLDEKMDMLTHFLPKDLAILKRIQSNLVSLSCRIQGELKNNIQAHLQHFFMAAEYRILTYYEMQVALIKSRIENNQDAIKEKKAFIKEYGFTEIADFPSDDRKAFLLEAIQMKLGEEERSQLSEQALIEAFYSKKFREVKIVKQEEIHALEEKIDVIYFSDAKIDLEIVFPIIEKIREYEKEKAESLSILSDSELKSEKLNLMEEGREILSKIHQRPSVRLQSANQFFQNKHMVFDKNNDLLILEIVKLISAGLIIALASLATLGFGFQSTKNWLQTRLFKTKSSIVLDSVKEGRQFDLENSKNISHQATCS